MRTVGDPFLALILAGFVMLVYLVLQVWGIVINVGWDPKRKKYWYEKLCVENCNGM